MCRMAQNCEILIRQDTVEKAGAPMAHYIVSEHCNLRCLKIQDLWGGWSNQLPLLRIPNGSQILTINLVLFCQGPFCVSTFCHGHHSCVINFTIIRILQMGRDIYVRRHISHRSLRTIPLLLADFLEVLPFAVVNATSFLVGTSKR